MARSNPMRTGERFVKDANGFETITKRVEYALQLGWIGDSEGRTWANELKEEHIFPTMEEAATARNSHPDIKMDNWGGFRTTYNNGQVRITRREVVIEQEKQA